MVEDENRYRILSPEYRGTRPLETLRPSTQAAYKVLVKAKQDQPEGRWTTHELVDLARTAGIIDPEHEQELDDMLDRFASLATPKYGSGAIEKIEFVGRQYHLSPTYADVIQKLVDTIASLNNGGTRTHKKLADTARELYTDAGTAHELASKAMANSPRAGK